MQPLTIHLIPNAHLDPVWLWDRREGLNAAWQTCRTVLDLMEEFSELTFIRGESLVYQHIEDHDPATFRRIKKMVKAGRWEIVGGTVIQPDTNLPGTETFLRHFEQGQAYFRSRFGQAARIAWAADSFGHSAGLPDILAEAGMEGIAFSRTGPVVPAKPAFWWEGVSGVRVPAYRMSVGWYGCERDSMPARLDQALVEAAKCDLGHIGVFFGLGNHGGGPTRRHVRDVQSWVQAHPEVQVVYSGLGRLFDAIRAESRELPIHRGELNFCLRGCYASVAKLKFAYRQAEAHVNRAERTAVALGVPVDLRPAWDAVLFNAFHDVLPGTSIERALEEQIHDLGGAIHLAHQAEALVIDTLAMRVDTQVPAVTGDHPQATPFVIWNPHPHEYRGLVELETCLDARPLKVYKGRPGEVPIEVRGPDGKRVAFQDMALEHMFFPMDCTWRKRVVVPVRLPPLGWGVYTMGWVEGAKPPTPVPCPSAVRIEGDAVVLWNDVRITAMTVEDNLGSWGDFSEQPSLCDLQVVRERWPIREAVPVEHGPLRQRWWVLLAGASSRMGLLIRQGRDEDTIEVEARVIWNDSAARLKLIFADFGQSATYDVPGGTVTRGACGEVPGGRWVKGRYGVATDALYNFNLHGGDLQATVCRGSKYAWGGAHDCPNEPWRPTVDVGELKFRFLVTRDLKGLSRLARELEMPPIVQAVPVKSGALGRSGTCGDTNLTLLSIQTDGNAVIVRIQNDTGRRQTAKFDNLTLGKLNPGEIGTWRISKAKGRRMTAMQDMLKHVHRTQRSYARDGVLGVQRSGCSSPGRRVERLTIVQKMAYAPPE
jgi:alpha-mannosidase